MFTREQTELLKAKLQKDCIKRRQQSGRYLSYIEGWHAIAEANRIFGFDGWTRETVELKCVAEKERTIGQNKAPGFGVSYLAKVRVTVFAGDTLVIREGCGAGHGIDRDLGQAHESALKEAETDSLKRALMTFGNQFGLALYDKEQEGVESGLPDAANGYDAAPPAPTNRTEERAQGKQAENIEWARSFVEKAFQCESVKELREWQAKCVLRLELMQKQQPATSEWIDAKLESKYRELEASAA